MQVTGLQLVSSCGHTRDVFSTSQVFDGEKLKPEFEEILINSIEQVFHTKVPLTLRPVIDWTEDYEDMWEKIDLPTGIHVMTLLRDGKKISAIKLVRQATGVGLKEAKRFIDSDWIWNIISDLGMMGMATPASRPVSTSVHFVQHVDTLEYFFTESHTGYPDSIGDDWVPVTISLPSQVEPREGFPDGTLRTKEDVRKLYLDDGVEIPFPTGKGVI